LPDDESKRITVLDEWLIKLHPSLYNSVRQRIESERGALPAPVLAPYLIGLLVMLGVLGTFIGLVETLKGVVVVLEGSAEMNAIRQAMTAPMEGLGLAFGTSVAGVATSAMLGLMSTLSKRERLLSCRQLDQKITTEFRCFSKSYQQLESLKTLEQQSQALPEVADKLTLLIDKMGAMSDKSGEQLSEYQTNFQAASQTMFRDLMASFESSLHESLVNNNKAVADSGHLVVEGIKPLLQDAMTMISETTKQNVEQTHQQLSQTVQEQLQTLSERFKHTSEDVTQAWAKGLAAHEQSNEVLTKGMEASFRAFSEDFSNTTSDVFTSFNGSIRAWQNHQQANEKERFDVWTNTYQDTHKKTALQLQETSNAIIDKLSSTAVAQQVSFESMTENVTSLIAQSKEQWHQAREQAVVQQQQITTSLDETVNSVINTAQINSSKTLSEINRLVSASEELVKARVETESAWLDSHEQRLEQVTVTLKNELSELRDDEMNRGQVAIERLAQLESSVATHLSRLGQALEKPMTELIELASETPRAAAEVIGQLRQEISNNIERDNRLLDERQTLIEKLEATSDLFSSSSTEQLASIEKMVKTSTDVLTQNSERFSSNVVTEISKVSEVADHFAASAVEISSLGDSFTMAVNLFNDSNAKMMDSLKHIEKSLLESTTRSDEQLGYYVAQAREVIDYSVLTQKEIFDEIRQMDLNKLTAHDAVEVN